jgi:ATP-binding cassette subfamily B multidrug efflux pump
LATTDNSKKNKFDFALLKRIFSFTGPYRKTLYTAVILAVVLAILSPLRPYLIMLSVDKYIKHNLLQGLIYISIVQLGLLIIESGLRFWFTYRTNWLGQTVVNDMRNSVFKKILYQNISFYDHTPIGTLTTRTINDIEAINDVFSEGIISIVADVLVILAIITVMLVTDWRLTLVCLSTFPCCRCAQCLCPGAYHRHVYSAGLHRREARDGQIRGH